MHLYHYTNQTGFLGIFTNKKLWATKIQYLNDDDEYYLAFKIAENYINAKLENESCSSTVIKMKSCLDSFKTLSSINVCVCSLSEQGDLLSQWRGYSSSIGGYSIGFNKESLENSLIGSGFKLVQCIYDELEQKQIIHGVVDRVINESGENFESTFLSNTVVNSPAVYALHHKLLKIAPKIKSNTFVEEAEWRIVSEDFTKYYEMEFRSGKSSLIPYIEIKLPDSLRSVIDHIYIGHTPHSELAITATNGLIIKESYKATNSVTNLIQIYPSKIPYRNW